MAKPERCFGCGAERVGEGFKAKLVTDPGVRVLDGPFLTSEGEINEWVGLVAYGCEACGHVMLYRDEEG